MDAIAEEQRYVDAAYALLAQFTANAEERIGRIAQAQGTGTAQDLLERQALFDNLAHQVIAARAATTRLCFGRLDLDDGRALRIGRIGLRDADGEPVLLDWRAPNAAPFYQATSVNPMGVRRRRRIVSKDTTVTHVEDEDLADPTAITWDAAARSVATARDGRMADIIATIAVDQDRIVRSPLAQVTVVEGGPGTGKTVVALHRAAWLLYTHRDRLARDGVLVVGPSNAFLRYIDQVLPSLGETDVVLLTPGQLFPAVSTSIVDAPDVAALKGDLVMARVVAQAVRLRIRVPADGVVITLGDGSRAIATAAQLADARRAVHRGATFHAGREPFLRRVLDHLARNRAVERGLDPDDADQHAVLVGDLADDPAVRRTLNLMWLPTTPERLVTRLLSDPGALAAAGEGLLSAAQQRLLLRHPEDPWTVDDVPLLDEAAERLGEEVVVTRRIGGDEVAEYRELVVEDDPHARRLHARGVAERALADRTWVYGHVVVDEAQELSHMAWRALARRCTRRSMTVVGDLHQASHPAAPRDWDAAIGWAGDRVDRHTLTVTYRITRQIAQTATQALVAAGGSPAALEPIRDGAPTEHLACGQGELAAVVLAIADRTDGRVGVVVPDAREPELAALLTKSSADFGSGDTALDARIAVLTARDVKGLEFDHVVVVAPREIGRQAARGADLYVACTRATQQLHVVDLTDDVEPPSS